MKWTLKIIEYWTENYYRLKNCELTYNHNVGHVKGVGYSYGETLRQPDFEETLDRNWEFDKALKSLNNEQAFRLHYIDGYTIEETMNAAGCSLDDIDYAEYQLRNYLMEGE